MSNDRGHEDTKLKEALLCQTGMRTEPRLPKLPITPGPYLDAMQVLRQTFTLV